jgi:hypothetical protein
VTSTSGTVVGHLFLYQGSPPWAMVAITDAPQSGDYTMVVLTTSGRSYSVGVCAVSDRSGTAGYPLTVPVAQIAAVELSRPDSVDRARGLTSTAADWPIHCEPGDA